MLLRRYLLLRDGDGDPPVAAKSTGSSSAATAKGNGQSGPPPASTRAAAAAAASTATAAEQHAVMASVVVLAERLGARVFGTGMQMLSCIRLVLEHEQPRNAAGVPRPDSGVTGGGGYGCVDAASRVAQMEAAVEDDESCAAAGGGRRSAEGGIDLGMGGAAEGDDDDTGDTLCSVVLALLTTILELGEEERTVEEEAELRAMLAPLKVCDLAGHNEGFLCGLADGVGWQSDHRLECKMTHGLHSRRCTVCWKGVTVDTGCLVAVLVEPRNKLGFRTD